MFRRVAGRPALPSTDLAASGGGRSLHPAAPCGMLARLMKRGLKIRVWINPYIAQWSALFAEGKTKRWPLRRPNATSGRGAAAAPG